MKETTIKGMNVPLNPVLVVEDVPNILELLEVALRFKGYPVITARNGQEALEKIDQLMPSLVITDILMPKMDGWSLVHRLRANPCFSQIPVIFLSATYVAPDDREFGMRLGAVRFLEKPIDTEVFLQTVDEVLRMDQPRFPPPLQESDFFKGYRERLEGKLRHKNAQIARTLRQLETLPEEQKPASRTLLADCISQREAVQRELDDLYHLLSIIP
jgi:CheY-like chemotaxis protein